MLVSDIVAENFADELRGDAKLYAACVAGAVSEAEYLAGLREVGMVDVEVRERLVYDAAQLAAMFGLEGSGSCCGSSAAAPEASSLSPLAQRLAGKVWSARVTARKPA